MAKQANITFGQRQKKSVTLDFTKMKGHASDSDPASIYSFEIPDGFYYAPNMWQIRTDDVLTTRTTYTKDTDDTLTYMPISCCNGGGAYRATTNAMLVVASSNGSATAFQRYDNNSATDASFTWSSAGSAPALRNTDMNANWARVGNNIVFCFRNTAPITLDLTTDQSHWTTGTKLPDSYGMCCTHLNRILVVFQSNPDRIYYSDAGNSEAGYSSYVTVGGLGESIRGICEMNGSLVVLKTNSIWMKGAYSQLNDTDFLPVATGIADPIANAYVVANNVLYYVNRGGIFAWSGGGQPVNISIPIWSYFQQTGISNIEQTRIGYWQALNKIWFKFGGSNVVHLYDINRQKWEQMSNLAWFTSANVDNRFYALSNASTEYRQWNDFTVIGAGKNETSLDSYVHTNWLDFGGRNYKYIKSLIINGKNVQAQLVGRRFMGDMIVAGNTVTPTDNKIVYPLNMGFREVRFVFLNSSNAPFVLKSCTITYEEEEEI